MAEPPKKAPIILVGGPGDKDQFTVPVEWSALRWKPTQEHDFERVRAMGFAGNPENHQFIYRRSARTSSKFVFQP